MLQIKRDSNAALIYAINERNLFCVQHLVINKGADIEARNLSGYTPLLLAAKNGHLPIVEYLVSKGVNLAAKNNAGKGVLALAKKEEVSNFLRLCAKEQFQYLRNSLSRI